VWARTPPAWAYFVLLAAGVASFVVPAYFLKPPGGPAAQRQGRGLAGFTLPYFVVFVFFALLSFAVVPPGAAVRGGGGAITVLNFQDYLRRRRPTAETVTRSDFNWGFGARAASLAACLLLAVGAWAGWLHGRAEDWRSSRHVRFSVAEDPGVVKAAHVIAPDPGENRPPEARLQLHPRRRQPARLAQQASGSCGAPAVLVLMGALQPRLSCE